jgi:hypothetical protein
VESRSGRYQVVDHRNRGCACIPARNQFLVTRNSLTQRAIGPERRRQRSWTRAVSVRRRRRTGSELPVRGSACATTKGLPSRVTISLEDRPRATAWLACGRHSNFDTES